MEGKQMRRSAHVRFRSRFVVVAVAVIGLLVTSLAPTVPADAARQAAPVLKKSARNLGTVLLHGRTARHKERLVLQRRTVRKRWVGVRRLTSHQHRFRIVVWKKRRRMAYRVVDRSSRRHSQVRKVPKLRVTHDACGRRPLKPNGEPWRCSFHDDFDGSTLDTSKWKPQTSSYATGTESAFACYRAENVEVGGGALRLELTEGEPYECPAMAEHEDSTTPYSAGMVSTYRRFSQQYGRFRARIRNTEANVSGLHEAFYLWPDVRYIDTESMEDYGEIDVSETYSSHPGLSIPYLHYPTEREYGPITAGPHTNTAYDCAASRGVFNTYQLDWTPSRIEIRVNGKLCLTNTSGDPAFRERYILALTQAMGREDNPFTEQTPRPATMEVDYVRAWR